MYYQISEDKTTANYCDFPQEGFIEMDDNLFYFNKYGRCFLKSYTETQQFKNEQTIDDNIDTIYELKQKLFNTDYVINKITEAQLLGNSVSAILSQYKDIIDQRQAWRDEINKLEAQNNELKTNN